MAPARATIRGFLGVVLRVQHCERHARAAQSLGQRLRLGHGGRADEHGAADRVRCRDVADDGAILRLAMGEDQIVAIDPHHGMMGGNDDHVEPVRLPQFGGGGPRAVPVMPQSRG